VLLTSCGAGAPKLLKSEDGGFEIQTPITLKEESQSTPTAAGNIMLHMYTGETNDRAYVVGYADYPAALVKMNDPQKLLDGARDGNIGSFQGKIVEEKKITIDGFPGRELTVDARLKNTIDANMRARFYIVNNRLYQIMVIGEKGKISTTDMDSFLQSFKLTKKSN